METQESFENSFNGFVYRLKSQLEKFSSKKTNNLMPFGLEPFIRILTLLELKLDQ